MLLLKTGDSARASLPQPVQAPILLPVAPEHSRLGNASLPMGVLNMWLWIPLLKPTQREIEARDRRLVLLTGSAEGMKKRSFIISYCNYKNYL